MMCDLVYPRVSLRRLTSEPWAAGVCGTRCLVPYWIDSGQGRIKGPEVRVDPDGGDAGWDGPPLDIQIPDDARELERDVLAYRRELRAIRRRRRIRRSGQAAKPADRLWRAAGGPPMSTVARTPMRAMAAPAPIVPSGASASVNSQSIEETRPSSVAGVRSCMVDIQTTFP